MTEKNLQQYAISREILNLARQLNLRTAQNSSKTQLQSLLQEIRILCKELEKEI